MFSLFIGVTLHTFYLNSYRTVAKSNGGPPPGLLRVDFPEGERNGVTISIDGKRMELPQSGPIKYSLAAGKHDVIIDSRGQHMEDTIFLRPGESVSSMRPLLAAPEPACLPNGADKWAVNGWLQDFEKAKQIASREQKNILLLFEGSDWCEYSQRLTREVFAKPDFKAQVAKDFVLVCIDSPRGSEANTRVESLARNKRLIEQFRVDGFPTVVLTDAKGRVFGELAGYKPGGVDAYVAALHHGKAVGEELLLALDRIEVGKNEPDKRLAALDAFRIVHGNDLEKYYRKELERYDDRVAIPCPAVASTFPAAVPPRPDGMAAEEFLKKCGLVSHGGTWVLAEDKEMIEGGLRALYDQAKAVDRQLQVAYAAQAKYEQAAKARNEAAQDLDALRQKLGSGVPVFASEMQKAQHGVEQAENAAKEAEATADAARTKAEKAGEQLQPKLAKLRQTLDYGARSYAKLAAADAVKKAIAELKDRDDGKKVLLGPSELFAAAGPRIEEIAKTVAAAAGPQPVAVAVPTSTGVPM